MAEHGQAKGNACAKAEANVRIVPFLFAFFVVVRWLVERTE